MKQDVNEYIKLFREELSKANGGKEEDAVE